MEKITTPDHARQHTSNLKSCNVKELVELSDFNHFLTSFIFGKHSKNKLSFSLSK